MTKPFCIDTERVMNEASQGEFTYLFECLTQQPTIFFKRDKQTITFEHGSLPIEWHPYLMYNNPNQNTPTLFHYIIKYNQKELLVLLYNKNVLDSWCASTIIREAILLNNKEFEDAAWIYLEDLFDMMNGSSYGVKIHPSLYTDVKIFGRVLRKIQENKGQPYYDKLFKELIFRLNNHFCNINDTWFEDNDVLTFYETHIKIVYDTIHYCYMKHLIKSKEKEGCIVILGLVLDPFLPKDIINHIISPYIQQT